MIPKVIHYCWFGRTKKPELIERCIKSWREKLPDFEIREWNEDNFDVDAHPYTKIAYHDKKWAFVSDYARLKILEEQGGVYLDTDMLVLRDLTPLLGSAPFVGKEDDIYVNAAIIGSTKGHIFIKRAIEKYDELEERIPIPFVLSKLLEQEKFDVEVYPRACFYPFSFENINKFNGTNAPAESYAVHMWNYSWASGPVKFARKIGVYFAIKNSLDRLGVKKHIKKLLKME